MSIVISESARYYDGKSGAAKNVIVMLDGSVLQIMQGAGTIESWRITDIQVLNRPDPPAPAIITVKHNPDARVYIEDGKGWSHLYSRLPKNSGKRISLPTHFGAFIGYIGVSAAVIVFVFTLLPRLIEVSAYLIPASVEKMIGQHVVQSMVSDKVCSNPKGQDALEKLLEKLKAQTERKIDLQILVADEPMIKNAFAAPGGYIILFSSLIDQAQSPDEIAGVLAHEISHIELYHTTKGMVRDLGFHTALKMMLGDIDYIEIAGFFNQLRYSKEDEHAADIHAVKILTAAGMNNTGLISFFKHIEEDENVFPEFFKYLSTHPETKTRIEDVKRITSDQRGKPAMSNEDWKNVRNICSLTKAYP